MKREAILLVILGLSLGSCAGVHGIVGNETGGMIPWSRTTERDARGIAERWCGKYKREARNFIIHRQYGDFISWGCIRKLPRH